MGIWFYEVTNVGNQRAEVYCGKNATARTLYSGDSQTPDWCIGYDPDPVQIATFGSDSLTWKIADGYNYELHVSASRDRGSKYHRVGVMKVDANYRRFNVWNCNNSILIENKDNQLQRASDSKPFRFFVATEGGTTEGNDPACMLNYMFD